MMAFALSHLCESSVYTGDLAGAARFAREEERLCRLVEDQQGLAWSLDHQAWIAYQHGDLDHAHRLALETLLILRKGGYDREIGITLRFLAAVEITRGA